MTLKEILKLENIKIIEDTENISKHGEIDFTGIDSEKFSMERYRIKSYTNEYKFSETTYSIYKNDKVVDFCLSIDEVAEFLEKLEEKYRNKEKSLLEQREEFLKKEEDEKNKKEEEIYKKYYEKFSEIMNDEKFNEILRKTLIEQGKTDIPTNGLYDENSFMKVDTFESYFKKEIEEYGKEGIYVRFTWDTIEFNLYQDKKFSRYSIIKDKESGNYKIKSHFQC